MRGKGNKHQREEETIKLKGIVGTKVYGDKLPMNRCGMKRERIFLAKKEIILKFNLNLCA